VKTTIFLGDPGERLAASSLTLAMLGQVHWGTSQDDDHKTDLRLVYSSPFSGERLELKCQAKTGDSFGDWTPTKQRYRIDLDPATREMWHKNTLPTLLVWLPQSSSTGLPAEPLYALIPPKRGRKEPIYFSKSAVVSPAMLFDVARRHHMVISPYSIRLRTFKAAGSLSESLQRLKGARHDKLRFPNAKLFRHLRITSRAFRHVSRRARPIPRRRLCAATVEFLPKLLEERPRRLQTLETRASTALGRVNAVSLLLLEYSNAYRSDANEVYSLFVRIREQVSFPEKWREALLVLDGPGPTSVQCGAKVISWYLKKQ
jgi:hypothetical protein